MNSLDFKNKWEKKRQRGITIYILMWSVLIPIGSIVGRIIGNYFVKQSVDVSISVIDIITLVMLSLLGTCLGFFSWNSNEKKYNKLKNS